MVANAWTTESTEVPPLRDPFPARRKVLVDPRRDEELACDGYTIVPLVDHGTVAELRGIYAVHHGWTGDGFEPDLNSPDLDYRRRVSQHLSRILDDQASARFLRHRPFMRVFLCKWTDAHSDLYIHRDWMYTDERVGFRTYVMWVALCDITREHGPLQVLPGSHLIDPMLRGTDLNAPWLVHQDVLSERLVEVPIRAGQAIVFDNQLIHASPPNRTDEPRLVAAMGMKDVEAPLVHFRRGDEGLAHRYDIDEDFFLTTTPAQLLEAPPQLPVAETIRVHEEEPSANELAALLDRDSARDREGSTSIRHRRFRESLTLGGIGHRMRKTWNRLSPVTMPRDTSRTAKVLVVTAAPDERRCTEELRAITDRLQRAPGLEIEIWFLRHGCTEAWPGSRVIDDLRTSPLFAKLDEAGFTTAAGVLRGRMLRRWWSSADPDIVVLDDGLGGRLIPPTAKKIRTVVRTNAELPSDHALEEPFRGFEDLRIADAVPHQPGASPATLLEVPPLGDCRESRAFADTESLRLARRRLDLPPEGPIIVGWGDDPQLHAPGDFVRTMSVLDQRGIKAHGLWLGSDTEDRTSRIISDAASAHALTDRIHHLDESTSDRRLCADVAFLPYVTSDSPPLLAQAMAAGIPVVSFPAWTRGDPMLSIVPSGDVGAAADSIADALGQDRRVLSAAAHERLDLGSFVDRLASILLRI